jgi:hypothetical protein
MLNISNIFAGLALLVSGVTFWFTLLRRGTVKMTQPAFVFFSLDGANFRGPPKVATCFHLYCTADRGRVVEGLYVRLVVNGVSNDFDVWVYGSDGLSRGSGVYVGRDGVTCNHHFLLPRTDETFDFVAGQYTVEFFGNVVGDRQLRRFFSLKLELSAEAATALQGGFSGVFFEWRPAKQRYEARIDSPDDRVDRRLRNVPAILGVLADAARRVGEEPLPRVG